MKKLFLMAAMASVLFAGCAKNESLSVEQPQSKISFNAPLMYTLSKANVTGEIDGTYPTKENFCVYALHTDGDFATWDETAGAGTLYMDEVEVAYIADANAWGADATSLTNPQFYYWPKQGVLTFAAYSPASMKNIAEYGNGGLKITGYENPQTLADQYDVMYSTRSYNRKDNTNDLTATNDHTGKSYDGVDILFKHALSSVKFTVAKSEENANIVVTSVTIKDAYYKGDFAENVTEKAEYESAPSWTPKTDKHDYAVWSGTQTLNTTVADLPNDPHTIVLPQTLATSGVSVVVKYTLGDLEQEATVSLATDAVDAWKPGYRYVYNISIGATLIRLSPEVYKWTEQNAGAITIQ